MLNILNPRNNTTNCSPLCLYFFSLDIACSTQHIYTHERREMMETREMLFRGKRREKRKARVNLIEEIKVDTYDDFANSL